ncbi:transketolase family protein [Candidatus Berkelbacteria bacterium]|nr:transketolase family protein [Candidatus Berkelbacteria bacterium]
MLNPKLYLNPKLFDKDVEQVPTRDGYGDGLVFLGEKNPNVVVLTGDLKESTRAQKFEEKFPDRFIECGVAEQNMMGIAAGLAVAGKIPFISSYAVFSPGRNWDQLRVSVCYNNANVKIAGAHTGVSVGPDGATHQALEDIGITRVLPNLIVMAPSDYFETKKATLAASQFQGPVYFRFAREKTPVLTTEKTPFKIGQAEVFIEGKDVSIIACGPLLYEALLAAKKLEKKGIRAEVINSHTIKPLDKKTILRSVAKTRAVVTVEEHQIDNGLGSAVAEILVENFPVPMERVGMPDTFGESGEPKELLEKYGFTAPFIVKKIMNVLKRKKNA